MSMKSTLPDPKKAKAYFEAKMAFTLGPVELKRMMESGRRFNLVDVRRAAAYERGHIPGAMSLPREDWPGAKGLKKGMLNVLYCSSIVCHLAPEACRHFAGRGFPVMELEGGYESWVENGMDIELPFEIDVRTEIPAEAMDAAMPQA